MISGDAGVCVNRTYDCGNLLQFPARRVTIAGSMAQVSRDSNKDSRPVVDKAVGDFLKGLSDEHRMLIALKAQLYGGSWEPMLDDLRNRLAGKPYIFKLASRIQDDIGRIEQMAQLEAEHNVELADYVDEP